MYINFIFLIIKIMHVIFLNISKMYVYISIYLYIYILNTFIYKFLNFHK